ncbi:MAG: Mut7-C RNAse domain-containing protein [Desulfobacterales bacterium]
MNVFKTKRTKQACCKNTARFRFYGDLNFFLPEHRKQKIFDWHFNGSPAVRNVIEGIGVPHTEPDLILANGQSVGFDCRLSHGDFVSVYPVFESLDISPLQKLRHLPSDSPGFIPGFIMDVHLGKAARIMRLLGFDVLYRNDYDDPEIVRIAAAENRVVLTRDRRLLFAKAVRYAYLLRSQNPETQVHEILDRFDLHDHITAFARCTSCNGQLEHAHKKDILAHLEPKTRKYYNSFVRCRDCGKIYWEGSHFSQLKSFVSRYRKCCSNMQMVKTCPK